MSEPIWKPVVGFESFYEVSSDGRVRRIAPFTKGRGCKDPIPRELKPAITATGYPRVSLSGEPGTRRKLRTVHILVAAAFIGPRPDGFEVNHIDRVRTNSNVRNLEYVTPLGNAMHRASFPDAYDSMPRGTKHHNCKLDEARVRAIRQRLTAGESLASLASIYGVHRSTIAQIRDRKTWLTA